MFIVLNTGAATVFLQSLHYMVWLEILDSTFKITDDAFHLLKLIFVSGDDSAVLIF